MITVADKTIKLQIWDTVPLTSLRLARRASSLSLEAITVRQQEPS